MDFDSILSDFDESKEKTNVSLQNSPSFISKKIIDAANKNQWKIERKYDQ